MFKEKFYYFIDADNVRPSRLPFELLPPQKKIYIVGNNNGKQVRAWETLLESLNYLGKLALFQKNKNSL